MSKPITAEGVSEGTSDIPKIASLTLTKAIRLNPGYAEAYYNRGLAHQSVGNLKLAISDFDKAINLRNDNARAYYNRGINQKALGNTKEAKADLEKARQLAGQQRDMPLYDQVRQGLENL